MAPAAAAPARGGDSAAAASTAHHTSPGLGSLAIAFFAGALAAVSALSHAGSGRFVAALAQAGGGSSLVTGAPSRLGAYHRLVGSLGAAGSPLHCPAPSAAAVQCSCAAVPVSPSARAPSPPPQSPHASSSSRPGASRSGSPPSPAPQPPPPASSAHSVLSRSGSPPPPAPQSPQPPFSAQPPALDSSSSSPPLPTATQLARPSGYDIIIFAGQSNMIGRDGRATPMSPLVTRDGFPLLAAYPLPRSCARGGGTLSVDVLGGGPLPFADKLPATCDCALVGAEGRAEPACAVRAGPPGLGRTFLRSYVRESLGPGRSVIVVPAAVGGQPVSAFDPDRSGRLWLRLRDAMRAALAYTHAGASPGEQLDNRVVGLLWLQGEVVVDATAQGERCESYFAALSRLVAAVRAEAGDAALPFVAGQLLQNVYSGDSERACSQTELLRLALPLPHAPGGGGIDHAALVSSAGLVNMLYRRPDTHANARAMNSVHYDSESLAELGARFHRALASLLAPPRPPGAPPSPGLSPRPAHACHWASDGSMPNSAEWDGAGGPRLHLFVRGVTPAQWHVRQAALVWDVKLVQWDAQAALASGLQPAGGAAHALLAGLPMRPLATRACEFDAQQLLSDDDLLAAEESHGYVSVQTAGAGDGDGGEEDAGDSEGGGEEGAGGSEEAGGPQLAGYALVNRRHASGEPPGSPNAQLSFYNASWSGAQRTTFTPYRFDGYFVIPLVRDEGSASVASPGNVRGATLVRGLRGAYLPIHQALGFPSEAVRAAAEAAGRPFIALVRAGAVVPVLQADGVTIVAERVRAQQTLAVRLPPPAGVLAFS